MEIEDEKQKIQSKQLSVSETINKQSVNSKVAATIKRVTIPNNPNKVYLVDMSKLLGVGSFGSTYISYLENNDKQIFACKVIAKQKIQEKFAQSKNMQERKEKFMQSLVREVQVWMKLAHPNIVQFFDFSETQNNYYFFMEYCKNGDLETLIKKKFGNLKEVDAIVVFQQLISGCKYLYDRGVYHRDLKLANVLINSEGVAKIADFGFCKMIEDHQVKDIPKQQSSVGTPLYMAPQILANMKYSIACDVWSLGVMFYEVLTGQLPWSNISSFSKPEELLQCIVETEIKLPPSLNVSKEVEQLIQKMLAKKEDDRISIDDCYKGINDIALKTFQKK
eukprot:TRINITY_DN10856_c0_g1_i4.p1 TRINITY_DN10856_c0_g1~~TRINITY_DN10856_c0_g1_i4.p1  ORF type:complete len:335 (-),score=59.19 TRINITY_DN10856_c0_g1_i4:300-1304(-)